MSGNLEEAISEETGAPAAVFTRLPMIIDELRRGPLPLLEDQAYSGTSAGDIRCDFGDSTSAVITAAGNGSVERKVFFGRDNSEQVILDYAKHKALDGYNRPRLVLVQLPNDRGQCRLRIKKFDALGSIAEKRMQLTLPPDYTAMTTREFVAKILE